MFDDVPENLPTGQPSAGEATPPAQPASESPAVPEPPIMDEGNELHGSQDGTLSMPEPPEPAAVPSNAAPTPAVDDLFAEVDGSAPAVPTPEMPAASGAPAVTGKKKSLRWVWILVVVFVVLGAIGAAAAFLLGEPASDDSVNEAVQERSLPPVTTPGITPADTAEEEPNDPDPLEIPVDKLPSQEPEPAAELDTDGDGLTDAEEARYGTTIHNPDTDNDGLFDREEVVVYGTNPLSADTDGDGFLDGAEVQNGYNPAGPGRLTEIPQ